MVENQQNQSQSVTNGSYDSEHHLISLEALNFCQIFDCDIYFLIIIGQVEAGEPNEAALEWSEVEVGGVRVVALGEESSGGRSVMLRTAAGYEEAANFLKQSLYGGRQKRIPGSRVCVATQLL